MSAAPVRRLRKAFKKRLSVTGGLPPVSRLPFCLELSKPIKIKLSPATFKIWYDPAATDLAETVTPEQREALIPRAAILPALSDEELADSTGAFGFVQSDGFKIADGCATHAFRPGQRQPILSADHVHVNHNQKQRSWTVKMDVATFEFGDAYFGLTNASRFNESGKTIVFDVRGNELIGLAPLRIHRSNLSKLHIKPPRDACVRITADLANYKMLWEVLDEQGSALASEERSIAEWRSARLCVCLYSVGDCCRILQ
jgi:hypothetical protein